MRDAQANRSILTRAGIRDKFVRARRKLEDDVLPHDDEFRTAFERSLGFVSEALDLFGSSGLAVSFNGGKDACVSLYLLMMVLAERDQIDRLSGPDAVS